MVVASGLVLVAGGVAFAVRSSCWMTGGGSIFDESGEVIYTGDRNTHGFELHCTPRRSDNLQVNDHASGQSFHLENADGQDGFARWARANRSRVAGSSRTSHTTPVIIVRPVRTEK